MYQKLPSTMNQCVFISIVVCNLLIINGKCVYSNSDCANSATGAKDNCLI